MCPCSQSDTWHSATCRYASPHLWNQLLHSVNFILFTLLLVHLILHISPHHSHHLRSHHLSPPLPFTPDLKMIGKGFYGKWVKSSFEQFITTQTRVDSTNGWIISQNAKNFEVLLFDNLQKSSESVTSYHGYVYVGCALSLSVRLYSK